MNKTVGRPVVSLAISRANNKRCASSKATDCCPCVVATRSSRPNGIHTGLS